MTRFYLLHRGEEILMFYISLINCDVKDVKCKFVSSAIVSKLAKFTQLNMKIVLQHSRFLRRYFVTMNTESISPSIGTIIYDLDVSQPMTNEILKKLRSIWLEKASDNYTRSKINLRTIPWLCQTARNT